MSDKKRVLIPCTGNSGKSQRKGCYGMRLGIGQKCFLLAHRCHHLAGNQAQIGVGASGGCHFRLFTLMSGGVIFVFLSGIRTPTCSGLYQRLKLSQERGILLHSGDL